LATFEEKVGAAIPALRRYARALARDPDIADELVQDTVLSALRSEVLFNGGPVRGRLYATLINFNRARQRWRGARSTVNASEQTGMNGCAIDIEHALSELTEEQRHALLLVVLEGLTYREVAEVQGVTIDAVKSRLALARRKVKNVLEGSAVMRKT
jgi:RNA polymerase sigma-70 factor (ECF subfamily)